MQAKGRRGYSEAPPGKESGAAFLEMEGTQVGHRLFITVTEHLKENI